MLVRALYLCALWSAISLLTTLIMGSRLRRSDSALSLLWLTGVILVGNFIAIFTFGRLLEIFGLSLLAFLFGLYWIIRLRDWNAPAQVTWSMTLMTTGLFVVYTFLLTAFSPLNPLSFIFALMFFFLEAITLTLALAHMHESLDVVCRLRWRRLVEKLEPVPGYLPMVSLQVPAYNEPVEVVKKTLDSLAGLNYPNFEVLVVDNNTPLQSTWRPLEEICRQLGPNFHCLHLDQWPGYKSGALNFAATQADPHAEIIGIIDADYEVDPNFLTELVPAFVDPQVAFVQTPQDYSDSKGEVFSESTYYGYKYFFEVSMPSRNERNAIIFAGTMGLIRKSVLQEIGGWDEWCITEDAEASLRILKKGYRSLYINRAFGSGLMPINFEGLKKQRFRWCFGGIQILKKHWEALMPWAHLVDPENKLTFAQRYYYLVGGVGWFSDVFNLLFAFFLVMGAVFNLFSSPIKIRPLTDTVLIIPAVFLLLHILRFIWVLRNRLRTSIGMATATMYSFFSLGWAVTLACIQGLVQREGVFLRTPKATSASKSWHAIQVTQWETAIGIICIMAGLLAFGTDRNWRTFSLCILLIWQGSLYLAAPLYSLLSLNREAALGAAPAVQVTDQGKPVLEQLAARWVMAFSMVLIGAFSLIRFLPAPTGLPDYVRFLPEDSSSAVDFSREQAMGPEPTATRSPTTPPSAAPTSALGATVATATVTAESANCRARPRGGSERITFLYKNQQVEILGRNDDQGNPWWFIKIPDSSGRCWLWGMTATMTGNVEDIPITSERGTAGESQ
jgi:cellulose synthase/poly-beta-1,6-N-acetylglucosamine synthase-like glycosyltransferase